MALDVMRRPGTFADLTREVVPLRTMMDRLLENAFTPSFPTGWNGVTAGFGWDVWEDENAFYIHCYLPGVDPNAVNVTVQDNVLTISGESKRDVPEGCRPLIQEIGYGRFERRLTLMAPVDSAQAQAEYHDGILKIGLPKAEAARPKLIKVAHGSSAPRSSAAENGAQNGASKAPKATAK